MFTATIDWCEPNFQVSNFIVEFWNTVTSFIIIAVGLQLQWSYPCLRHILVIFIGVGSVLFHGTLTHYGQLIDELSMLWFMIMSILALDSTHALIYCIIGIQVSLLMWKTTDSFLFIFTFTGFTLLFMIELYKKCKKTLKHRIRLRNMTALFASAMILWLLDLTMCDTLGHFYLHACWHIIASFIIYNISKLVVLINLCET